MTTRRTTTALTALIIPVLLGITLMATPAQAADYTLRLANVTMVPLPPTCEVRATKRVIRSGGSVDIVWKSNAKKMFGLTQEGNEWPADGRQRVSIAVLGKHVFPLTFVAKNGATSTCSATVFVHAKKK